MITGSVKCPYCNQHISFPHRGNGDKVQKCPSCKIDFLIQIREDLRYKLTTYCLTLGESWHD